MREEDSCDLLRRSQTGDQEALHALLVRHYPALLAFARFRMNPLLRAHASTEDLVQSTCRELLQRAEGFDYRGEEAFRAWLFKALLHKLQNHERHLLAQKRDVRRNKVLSDDSALAAFYSSTLCPEGELLAVERIQALERALDSLPEHYREVISLSRFARLSRAAVAEAMGRSEDSVRSLLTRALVALAGALDAARPDGGAGPQEPRTPRA